MRRIGRLLAFDGPHAWILNLQRRCDDQDLGQAVLVVCREQHSTNSRIDRQSSQLFSQRRQLPAFVDGPHFKQCLEAVTNSVGARRIGKRKLIDLAQSHGKRLQNHRR